MMKVLTALIVLLTVSTALAEDVTITCAQVGTTNEVTVSYAADTAAHKPRSIALNIQLSGSYLITKVTKLTNNKYWVYPGTIDCNVTPIPSYDGTPVAAGGVGFNNMTIEMASLHKPTGYDDANAPAQSGDIIKFNVTPIAGTCTATISGNAQRNNVVRYDVQEATTNLPVTCNVQKVCIGDINGDNIINKTDISTLVSFLSTNASAPLWRVLPSHPNWNPAADINGDNVINKTDISTLVSFLSTNATPPLWRVPCP